MFLALAQGQIGSEIVNYLFSYLVPVILYVITFLGRNQEAALDLLLDSGGDMSIRDCAGNTALHHACVQQQKTTALQLLDKASEGVQEKHLHSLVNSANEEQKTPLHIAGSAGLTEVDSDILKTIPSLVTHLELSKIIPSTV